MSAVFSKKLNEDLLIVNNNGNDEIFSKERLEELIAAHIEQKLRYESYLIEFNKLIK